MHILFNYVKAPIIDKLNKSASRWFHYTDFNGHRKRWTGFETAIT
jgi:hypothetical protein